MFLPLSFMLPIVTSYGTNLSFSVTKSVLSKHRLTTIKRFLQPIFFKTHLSLRSNGLIFKYKISIFGFYLVCFNKIPMINSLVIIPMFQINLSNRTFHFVCHKMSYISFMIAIIQKALGDYVIGIHEIIIMNNF